MRHLDADGPEAVDAPAFPAAVRERPLPLSTRPPAGGACAVWHGWNVSASR